MKHKIILDCDPGHDDAIAILLAARHPEIDLLVITTVAGNQFLFQTDKVMSYSFVLSLESASSTHSPNNPTHIFSHLRA